MPPILQSLRARFAPSFPPEWSELDMLALKSALARAGGDLGNRDLAALLGMDHGLPLLQAFARHADRVGLHELLLAGENREAFYGAAWLVDCHALPRSLDPARKQEHWALTLAAHGREAGPAASGISLAARFKRLAQLGCSLDEALGAAISANRFETIMPLIQAGACPNVCDIDAKNVFHVASGAPDMTCETLVDAVLKLVEAGAASSSIGRPNARGLSPFAVADERFPGFGQALANAAEAGAKEGPHGQYLLAALLDGGLGVQKDVDRSRLLYRKAAEAGLAQAQYAMGVFYLRGDGLPEDFAEAVRWLRQAEAQGHVPASHSLGLAYFHGHGVIPDRKEAQRLLELAAAAGHDRAQYALGLMLVRGGFGYQDGARALKLWRAAAKQGEAHTQFALGSRLLERGDGQSVSEALNWLERVADNPGVETVWRIDADVGVARALGLLALREGAVRQTRPEQVLRLSRALERSLGDAPSPVNPIRNIAHSLLELADPAQTHFNLNGVPVARSEIESLARGDNERAVVEGTYRLMQQGWGANVHLDGFMVQGTRLLEMITARNEVAPPSIAKTRDEIEAVLASMPGVQIAARRGLQHMLGVPAKVEEAGLKTTTKETLRQMWAYVRRQDDPTLRDNLTEAFVGQLASIGAEEPCNTGCVQRILQTPEGIDSTLTSNAPDEGALKEEMLSLAAEVNTEIEEFTQLEYEGQQADPEAVTRLKEDMIRARIEARFVQLRGLPKETIDKVAAPVIDMVKDL